MRGDNINMVSEEAGVKHTKHENALWTGCSVGLWAGLSKSEHFFPPSQLPLAVLTRTARTGKERKATSMSRGLSSALRKVGLSLICHRFPMWLVAQHCARDSAVPYLQGYSKDECIEDRTSQTILLALDIVIAEHTWVREQECRQKFALC